MIILMFELFGVFSLVLSEELPDLCKNPEIYAADRLSNNTYRVYRDNYYWELLGLPDIPVRVKGPFKVWYQHMAPVDSATSIQTVVNGGNSDKMTYKFRGKKYWMYKSESGQLVQGGKYGFDNSLIPGSGFNAVLNDGKMGGKSYPIMIGFEGIRAYYYNTNDRNFRQIGSSSGYQGGMNNENFPADLKAAFAFPSSDPEVKYFVVLFKNSQFCFRPIIADKECKQWRENKYLFNCSSGIASNTSSQTKEPEQNLKSSPQSVVEPGGGVKPTEEPQNPKPDIDSSESSGGIFTFLVLIIIGVIIVVAIVVGIVVFAMKGKPQSNKKSKQSKVSAKKSTKKIASKA